MELILAIDVHVEDGGSVWEAGLGLIHDSPLLLPAGWACASGGGGGGARASVRPCASGGGGGGGGAHASGGWRGWPSGQGTSVSTGVAAARTCQREEDTEVEKREIFFGFLLLREFIEELLDHLLYHHWKLILVITNITLLGMKYWWAVGDTLSPTTRRSFLAPPYCQMDIVRVV